MSLILRFNKYILVPTLIEWLHPSDFLVLDSALCNHTDRSYLLTILQDYAAKFQDFMFSTLPPISLSVSLFNWITQRLRNLKINNPSVVLRISNSSISKFRLSLGDTPEETMTSFFSLIKRLEISQCSEKNQTYLTDELLVTHNRIKEVVVVDTNEDDKFRFIDPVVSSVADNFSNLRVFHLNGCRFCEQNAVISVVRNCRLLEDIDVGGVKMKEPFMRALTVHGRHVRRLHASHCSRLHRRSFLLFFLHNSAVSLEALRLPLSSRVDLEIALRSLMWYRGGDQLKLLDILVGSDSFINLDTMAEISRGLPNIEHLCIGYLPQLSSSILSTVFDHWNKLTVLHLQYLSCSQFRRVLSEIFTKCHQLQELNCFQNGPLSISGTAPDADTVSITSFNCHELTVLVVSGNIATNEYRGMLTQSTKLKVLTLNQSVVGTASPLLTENVAIFVGPYLMNVEEFAYPRCATQRCFELLVKFMQHLRVLTIPLKCQLPADPSINLTSVTRLTYSKMKKDPVPGEELWLCCPNLRYLYLPQDFGLPYATSLVENLPRLKELVVRVKIPQTHQIFKLNKNLIVTGIRF